MKGKTRVCLLQIGLRSRAKAITSKTKGKGAQEKKEGLSPIHLSERKELKKDGLSPPRATNKTKGED